MSTEPMTQDQSEQDPNEQDLNDQDQSEQDHPSPEDDTTAVPEDGHDSEMSEATAQDISDARVDDADAASDADATGEEQAPAQGTHASESTALDTGGRSRSSRKEDLEHEGEVAADFLESLLDIADLDGDLEVNVEGDRAAVSIVDSEEGSAPTSLVGQDGAVLEALQELTRLAVQADTGDRSRLMLDVAGHRAGRRAELVELARATSAQVKESGERASLAPMSAFERKVVHDEVLANGLVSESEGVEPKRHVVILPNN